VTKFVFAIVASIVFAGCKPPYVEAGRNGAVIRSSKLGLYRKEVVAKDPPETLVAADGTICRVAPDVYKTSAEHSLVYCNWQ
jgi:hypothetical protein